MSQGRVGGRGGGQGGAQAKGEQMAKRGGQRGRGSDGWVNDGSLIGQAGKQGLRGGRQAGFTGPLGVGRQGLRGL